MTPAPPLHTTTVQIDPAPPFDFAKSLDFLGEFAPTRREQTIVARRLAKAINVAGRAVLFQLSSSGSIDAPQLECALVAEQPLSEAARRAAIDRVRFYLSLDDDLRPFYDLGRADPAFAPILEALYGYHQVKFPTPFEAACWAILTQRTPMSIAGRVKQALLDRYGVQIEVAGARYQAFPEPARIAALSADDLAEACDNRRKAEYLLGLAAALAATDEAWLRTAPYAEVETWLRAQNGIGPWSASFVLLRGLGRAEQAPLSEKRLLDAVGRRYADGRALSEREVAEIARPYGPWQGYWAHYLRVAG